MLPQLSSTTLRHRSSRFRSAWCTAALPEAATGWWRLLPEVRGQGQGPHRRAHHVRGPHVVRRLPRSRHQGRALALPNLPQPRHVRSLLPRWRTRSRGTAGAPAPCIVSPPTGCPGASGGTGHIPTRCTGKTRTYWQWRRSGRCGRSGRWFHAVCARPWTPAHSPSAGAVTEPPQSLSKLDGTVSLQR